MNNILVPYDFNSQAKLALEWSINLARQMNCSINLLYVNEIQGLLSSVFTPEQDEEFLEKVVDQLDATAAKTSLKSGINIEANLRQGHVYQAIKEVADELQSSFIVMGTRSNESSNPENNSMAGRNTSRVIRISKCPVITIGGIKPYESCKTILLPLDLTKITRQKIAWAVKMANLYHAEIKVVSALWSLKTGEIAEKLAEQLELVKNTILQAGIPCTTKMIETPSGAKTAVPCILEYARQEGDIDLIVIMTQQESALVRFFLGTHAQEFIRIAEIPVMSVVPEDLES
jgi:nucleotide-binding universal stress UspA family protein